MGLRPVDTLDIVLDVAHQRVQTRDYLDGIALHVAVQRPDEFGANPAIVPDYGHLLIYRPEDIFGEFFEHREVGVHSP